MFARVLAAAGLFVCANATAQTSVFVNELHYDNVGTDQNETVEVAAPAGTNLTGWSIVLYNGSGGVTYATLPLSGSMPGNCGSHGVMSVAALGLQNGAPDGLALVDNAGSVVQFLSYEGSFVASNGPAMGMTSMDIGVSESESTAATASLALTGTGTFYESFAWGTAATATFGGCNAGQSFAAGVDVPPTVASTSPANGALNVPVATNIVISFSESVTVTGAWFGLACAVSGNLGLADVVVTQVGSSTFTLDPNVNFANFERCDVTVVASRVVDQDGMPQPLATDYLFGFTTVADVAPVVSAVSPIAGATGVPPASNVTITFSEAVTAGAGAFGLACGGAAQSATRSGGPVQYTLNPASDLPLSTSCTLTVSAAQVVDQDGSPNAMQGDYTSSFTTGAGASNYYATADASSTASLRATLHEIIDDHTRFPYTDDVVQDTWDVLKLADEDPLDTARVLDIYRNTPYAKAAGGNAFYNREHTWPNSLGFPIDGPQNSAYTDTHMLMLSDIGHNAARGNLPFGTCASGEAFTTIQYFGQGGPGHDNLRCGGFWQVWDALRGNVARAILYMDIRYEGGTHGVTGFPEPDLRLTDNAALITQSGGNASIAYMGLLATLLAWHDQDPPDEREVLRNGIVQSFQGNRNPFVDHPEWADCLYRSVCSASTEIVFANSFE